MSTPKRNLLADDDTESITTLLRLRLPWLVAGLLGGTLMTYFISRYESLLSQRVTLAYFIPVIVYLSDAVGTQTEAVLVRNLARGRVNWTTYLFKELALGIIFGSLFGSTIGLFAWGVYNQLDTAWTVGTATLATVSLSPILASGFTYLIYREHQDPAVGAGPLTTIVQDAISVLIYFAIASWAIFN